MLRHLGRTLLPCGFLLLAACSGGGGGDEPPAPPGPATADTQLLPYLTAAGDLMLFDPAHPSAPVPVDTGVSLLTGRTREVTGGTYDPATHALTDAHRVYVLYVKGGELFRASLVAGANHDKVQIPVAASVCRMLTIRADYLDPGASRVMVETAGDDADCGVTADNGAMYVRVDTGGGTLVSRTGFLPVASVQASTGSLLGLLVVYDTGTGFELRRYAADLSSFTTVTAMATGSFSVGPSPDRATAYFSFTKADTAERCVYRYNADTGQISTCLLALTDPSRPLSTRSETDGSHLYVGDGALVHRIGHSQTSATQVHDAGTDFAITELWLSSAKIVINGTDSVTGDSRVEAVPRAGGTAAPLASAAPGDFIFIDAASAGRVYLTIESGSGTGSTAVLAPDSGIGIETYDYAGWGGMSRSAARLQLGLRDFFNSAYHIVLGQADPTSGDVTSYSVDAQTGTVLQELGTISNSTEGLVVNSFSAGIGRHRLAQVTVQRPFGGPTDDDVYYADTLSEGSLTPLATTYGETDKVVR